MEFTACTRFPTHHATLEMLGAAVEMAETVGQPQCIVIVDASGELLGEVRMTGAKFLSRRSAWAKALTAASTGAPSTAVPEAVRPHIAVATGGDVTGSPVVCRSGLRACCLAVSASDSARPSRT